MLNINYTKVLELNELSRHRVRCPWWSSDYDARPDSKRLVFNSPFRHRFFLSVKTHCYMWCPMGLSLADCFFGKKNEDKLSPKGGKCHRPIRYVHTISIWVWNLELFLEY